MATLREVLLYEAMYGDKEPPKSDYPSWICRECAMQNGGRFPKGHIATFHIDKCGWCEEKKTVSEPRDYAYPRYKEGKNIELETVYTPLIKEAISINEEMGKRLDGILEKK